MADQVVATAANEGSIPKVQNIFDVSSEFLGQFKTWLEQNPPAIPITQIIGFTQFVGYFSEVNADESTTSASYADMTTVGPQLTGLPPGSYLVMVGAVAKSGNGNGAFIAPSINGAVAGDSFGGETQSTVFTSIIGVSQQSLTQANNTVKAVYRSNDAGISSEYLNRWVFVLKLANS